jgi:hypothetical protein
MLNRMGEIGKRFSDSSHESLQSRARPGSELYFRLI